MDTIRDKIFADKICGRQKNSGQNIRRKIPGNKKNGNILLHKQQKSERKYLKHFSVNIQVGRLLHIS